MHLALWERRSAIVVIVPVLLQVLVYHDLLGMMQHPHHAKVTPKFCKKYAAVGEVIQGALHEYAEVSSMPNAPADCCIFQHVVGMLCHAPRQST